MQSSPNLVISLVSHGQGNFAKSLLHDLDRYTKATSFTLLLTLNVPETLPFDPATFSFPIQLVHNEAPKGFAANHNAAFKRHRGEYFCVLNPDLRLPTNPFPVLMEVLLNEMVGVTAPKVLNSSGATEDSARRLPTPLTILKKLLSGDRSLDYQLGTDPVFPDWVAGMFLLFRSEVFARLGGFGDRYFLYYEDVDICCRLRLARLQVVLDPSIVVVHDARRDSRRKFRYLLLHISSMLKFFSSRVFFSSLAQRDRKA